MFANEQNYRAKIGNEQVCIISVIVLLLFHVGFWVIVFQTTVSSNNVIYLFI